MGLMGSLLLWLAQPPMMLGWLGWLAPTPWLLLVTRPELTGWRSFGKMYLAGALYWAAAVWWIALPHPLTPIGLFFLSAYLGCYPLAFVVLSRVGVHRLGWPLLLVAPVVWTGLELLQARLFSGFLMAALSHTQAFYPDVIQIAEWFGAYGVSFVMVLFAAAGTSGVAKLLERRAGQVLVMERRRPPVELLVAGLVLALVLFIGHHARQTLELSYANAPRVTVALIQGDTRATWDPDPARASRIMERQMSLSRKAVSRAEAEGKVLDLLVWPESMFRTPLFTFDGEFDAPDAVRQSFGDRATVARADMAALASWVRTPMLVGIDRYDYHAPYTSDPAEWGVSPHNSAALINAQGELESVYNKMHRVPFGEYVPLFEDLPAMGFLTQLPTSIRPGIGPVAMRTPMPSSAAQSPPRELTIAPNICYETVIPHVIRGHVKQLADGGARPDLLANVTNNAWFWGSSELEMHLACNILRAVENRTPMVIAANGGLSAAIDSSGRVLHVSTRMTEQVLLARVPITELGQSRTSFYTRWGDLLGWACLIVCGLLAIIGFTKRKAKGDVA